MRYPVYVPSKGRYEKCRTAEWLTGAGIPHSLVVEEPEAYEYSRRYTDSEVLVLPFCDQGVTASRNWIKEHATATGAKRHWQIDDDMYGIAELRHRKRIPCDDPAHILGLLEGFVDRYSNVALAGLRTAVWGAYSSAPFSLNTMVYGMYMVLNELPYRWRGLGEDTDYALQVLSGGWCTILFNQYQFRTVTTGAATGGNTPYYESDGRLKRARELERLWPKLVRVERADGKPRHNLASVWRKFDTKLQKVTADD